MNNKQLLLLPLLIIIWLLIKLGLYTRKICLSLFLSLSHLTKFIVTKARLSIQSLKSKVQNYGIFSSDITSDSKNIFPITLPQLYPIRYTLFPKRKRGRPRTQSLFRFYLQKLDKRFKKTLPSSVRITILFGLIVVGLYLYSVLLITLAHDLPSPDKLSKSDSPLTTTFYSRDGQVLYRLYEGKNRQLVNLESLPRYLIQATIAMEDKNFYTHNGVDFGGLLRALVTYVQTGQIQGASTITQQLIKNTLLSPDRTITRKLKQMALAFWAERIYSKDEILQMYFNEVPYGGPAWGIEAASQTYFGKSATQLTLTESAFLAGLPASPTTYSPYGSNPELGQVRQREVFRRMVEEGYLAQEQADLAASEPLEIKPPVTSIKAPHFVMYTRASLAQKYGERVVSQGGLQIYTTLDLKIQEMAETVVEEEVAKLSSLNVTNGAAMITDATTGRILAMVGSKNYFDSNYNVATALRQPGSSIKVATYATAFKQGYTPATLLLDSPVTFKNTWESYSPVNYDSRFHGPVTIRTALGSSYNVPAVKTLSLVGIANMIQTAKELGITTFEDPSSYGLSLTLGGGEVRLLDMMTVYGTLSQLGVRFDPQPILKVTDANGQVLEDNTQAVGKRVLPAGVAYLLTDILTDNKARTPSFGPNSLLNIPGYTVATKTGTTDSKRDNWCFGFTPKLVVGAWVGNNNNAPMHSSLTSGVTGATPIWHRIMVNLLQDQPQLSFTRPPEVIEAVVDGRKDLAVKDLAPKSVVGFGKKRIKEDNGQEKETITFTDPFSTYAPPESQPPPP